MRQLLGRAVSGQSIALAAAVILTAKGEFDLAVLAHFAWQIAWMFPVMLDVYVITAFHRRRWPDMVVGMLLMIFCQVAVHLLPVFIDTEAGEEVPWGLVVAVACVAPVVVVRVKMLAGRTAEEIAAAQDADRAAEELRAARAETTAVRQALAEAEERARAETVRAEAETAARQEAETARAVAETRAAAEAETRAEIEAITKAEIIRHEQAIAEAREAARVAAERAAAEAEAARMAEGRLAEARDAADRAAAARVLAEQTAAGQIRALTDAAEQAKRDYRAALTEAREAARAAQGRADDLADEVRVVQAQRDEAQRFAERQATARALAEQESQAVKDARDGLVNELERTRRALARAQEKAEINVVRQPEILRPAARKSIASFPVDLPPDLPEVETVKPETVAVVLAARGKHPEMTNRQLAEITGISDRTIRKVLNAVPAEIVGRVLALTSEPAA
ncbi:hypothetical protein [Micromonospora eburnea]|uniref:Uncharacterized protein n=1 Tax=Micromonospora eburnea TaxID=227316 RepID=A0A1C6VFV4_9ACTN|nr:hypothetical protein [Micromonospora eburnea]SCL64934.1 hypothetical protein GA0070604_5322 [Micromonospora eburnea]